MLKYLIKVLEENRSSCTLFLDSAILAPTESNNGGEIYLLPQDIMTCIAERLSERLLNINPVKKQLK